MRESRTYGSGRGARGNSRPYREPAFWCIHLLHPLTAGLCRFSDAGDDDLATRSGSRRPKTCTAAEVHRRTASAAFDANELSSIATGSLWFDVGGLDHPSPFLDLALDELPEVFGRSPLLGNQHIA